MTDVPVTRRVIRTDENPLGTMPYRPITPQATPVTHVLTPKPMCPVSGNPAEGSTVTISYTPLDRTLEVVMLRAYLDAFAGGRVMPDGVEVLSMEQVPEVLARDAAGALGVKVDVLAELVIHPDQELILRATAGGPTGPGPDAWFETAAGGFMRVGRVQGIEPEMRTANRWVIEAHVEDGSVELAGEFATHDEARAAVRALLDAAFGHG